MIRIAYTFTRLSAPVGATILATALAACGSSSSAGPSPSMSVSTSVSMSVQPGALPTNIAALCAGLNSADLSSLSHSTDPASALQAWQRLAADAPDAIKADMQTVASFLQAAVNHDYATLQGTVGTIQTAITHITTYMATNCRS